MLRHQVLLIAFAGRISHHSHTCPLPASGAAIQTAQTERKRCCYQLRNERMVAGRHLTPRLRYIVDQGFYRTARKDRIGRFDRQGLYVRVHLAKRRRPLPFLRWTLVLPTRNAGRGTPPADLRLEVITSHSERHSVMLPRTHE